MTEKIISIVLLISLIITISACSDKSGTESQTNALYESFEVMDETVTSEEIEYFVARDRSSIINYFASEYEITDFSDFWERTDLQENPMEKLIETAKNDAALAKIKLVLMKENGIYDDITFIGLKEKASKFNDEHENQEGNVGINSIDLDSFYTYYISTGEMELKNVLSEGKLKPTEDEINEKKKELPDLTDEGVISEIVRDKYEILINELVEKNMY